MAGLGTKLWTSGEVVTAANVNGYLQDQTIGKFATTNARDAAFGGAGEPTLSEGMFAYTSDTNTLWFYTGSVWEVAAVKPSDYYSVGKNRIINGAMEIDQRNVGAAVTINTAAVTYSLDRWRGFGVTSDGVFSIQQVVDAPSGLYSSLKATVTTADASLGATDSYFITQNVEGYNVADFGLGTASAKTFTLSFWVKSSLTGTFGGSFRNSDVTRSYPFTYSISSANTWEYKTVTVAGDTTGTWEKTNQTGINVNFSLGAGSSRAGTAGAWNSNNNSGATGQTQVISTLNATLFVTGVQLEIGSGATSFSRAGATIQGELAACQRYYEKSYNLLTAVGTATLTGVVGNDVSSSANAVEYMIFRTRYEVRKRATPTITTYDSAGNSGKATRFSIVAGPTDNTTSNVDAIGEGSFRVFIGTGLANNAGFVIHYTASAEL